MSCSSPLYILNKCNSQPRYFGKDFSRRRWLVVPCGYCLQCRRDKRNFLSDAANWHFGRRKFATFLTLTYDNIALLSLVVAGSNPLIASLSRNDPRNFIKRFRSFCSYHGLWRDCISRDFSYYFVGEYGGQFNRPHYHFILFGVDFEAAKWIFRVCWKKGIIDSRPIVSGGIRYVMKYFDKSFHPRSMEKLYDDKGLERPFYQCSRNFCSEFIASQKDFILSHDGRYLSSNNKLRPVPLYFWSRFLSPRKPLTASMRDFYRSFGLFDDDFKKVLEFASDRSLMKEESMAVAMRSRQDPVDLPEPNLSLDSTALDSLAINAYNLRS